MGTALVEHLARSATSTVVVVSVLQGATGATFLCCSAVAGFRYRRTDDPRRLMIAVGAGAIGATLLVFRALWSLFPQEISSVTVGGTVRSAPTMTFVYLTLTGWAAAGIAFIWAIPWTERRGRPPIGARRVVLAMVVGLGGTDALLFAFPPSPRVATVGSVTLLRLHAIGPVLAVIAATLLGIQALREWRTPGRAHAIAGAALSCAAFATFAVLLLDRVLTPSTVSEIPFGWARYLPLVSAALLFASELADSRTELSRMRRETDRAAEITGGRAEIASMVAHEIRGPVTTIHGLAQTSERHYDRLPEEDRREFLRLIEAESERLLRIADQTSVALRVDAGTLGYTIEPEDLSEVVGVGVQRSTVGDHPVTAELDPGIRVAIDSVRIGETVRELVENAALFSPPASPIVVRAYRDGASAVVEVIDRGPGIPPERRELVFTKFPGFRPEGYGEVPGTGLGLFICRAHVLRHGGTIEVDDGPDGGTMLRITLPEREEGRRER